MSVEVDRPTASSAGILYSAVQRLYFSSDGILGPKTHRYLTIEIGTFEVQLALSVHHKYLISVIRLIQNNEDLFLGQWSESKYESRWNINILPTPAVKSIWFKFGYGYGETHGKTLSRDRFTFIKIPERGFITVFVHIVYKSIWCSSLIRCGVSIIWRAFHFLKVPVVPCSELTFR